MRRVHEANRLATPFLRTVADARLLLLTLLALVSSSAASEDPPRPQPLTAEQKALLQERDRYSREVTSLRKQKKWTEAITAAEKMLALERKVFGNLHGDVAGSLCQLAEIHQARENFPAARQALNEVVAILTKLHGETHWQVTDARLQLADVERWSRLEPAQRRLLTEAAQRMDEGDRLYRQGQFRAAVDSCQKAWDIRRKILGENHLDCAVCLSDLALFHIDLGEYARAEPLCRQALAIAKQVLGEQHPSYATTLSRLALLSYSQGDYLKAESLYRQTLAIRVKVLGELHCDCAYNMSDLAVVYQFLGDPARAEALFRQSLAIFKKLGAEKDPLYAVGLNNLAQLYRGQGKYAEAAPLYEEALAIAKVEYGDKHPNYALLLDNLAGLYRRQGRYAESEKLYREALVIRKQAFGERHPMYSQNLNNLAKVYSDQGEYARAEPLYRQAVELDFQELDLSAAGQAERQQFAHMRSVATSFNNYLACTAHTPTPAAQVYAPVLTWKGAVTARQRQARLARTTAAGDPDSETARLFRDLDAVSRQLATLSLTPHDPRQAATQSQKLHDLEAQRERLEADLSRRTEAFRNLRASRRLTPAGLQKLLPEGSVLIDFVEYRPAKGAQVKPHLTAFVVSRQRIDRVELGETEPIAQAVDRFRTMLQRTQPLQGKDDPAGTLRDKLWQPVEKHLAGAKLVLLSPDGPLSRLPFAALPNRDGTKFLLEEVALAVLPVPQMLPELLAKRDPARTDLPPSLLAVGDVDFDAAPGGSRPSTTAPAAAWQRRRAGDFLKWTRLPATRGEVIAIEDTFRKAVPLGKLTTLREDKATEAAVRQLAPQHEYLHLATHGFFAPPHLKSVLDSRATPTGPTRAGPPVAATSYHPGLLSGLALTGANRPAADGDDGVLTALEVGELDLSKVELAVLSACETGLGEVAGGEGVLGLQRAFQVAGARSTIASLWKVDDEATRRMMERFYENYWKKQLGVLEALREAQLWLLADGVRRGMVRLDDQPKKPARTPPYYWAAFLLSGDWR